MMGGGVGARLNNFNFASFGGFLGPLSGTLRGLDSIVIRDSILHVSFSTCLEPGGLLLSTCPLCFAAGAKSTQNYPMNTTMHWLQACLTRIPYETGK